MIPVNEPLLGGNEKKYVMDCLETGWISSEGPYITKFEEKFAKYIGKRYGVAVCNGTAALETALYAAGIGKGDEIIMPAFTIISCAIAAIRLGAVPVLVDIEPETWNMDVSLIEAKITSRTKAIMPVHIYGHPVDMDPVLELSKKHGLIVIEDAAEVHGAEYKGRKCGSIGHISSWSFYANKLVTTGEGGMVLLDDENQFERAKSYRNLCFLPQDRFLHHELGYNFRITNMQAAIGLAQVERLDEIVMFKRKMGELYRDALSGIKELRFQSEKTWAKTVYWMYSVELQPQTGLDAKYMMVELGKRKIGTRPFFRGMHDQPVFRKMGLFQEGTFPRTDYAYKYGFYLPSGMTLTEDQIFEVAGAIKEIIAAAR